MWCSECSAQYPETEARCPFCGGELTDEMPPELMDKAEPFWGVRESAGRLLEEWPLGDDGQPVAPAFLVHAAGTDMSDEVLAGKLSAYGIPVIKEYPQDGAFGKIVLGISGNGTDLYVPGSMLEDAKALILGGADE